MVLVLSVLRCPDAAVPGTRRVPGGDFTLGRAEGCDWVLADPDRVLSKRHCTLEFRGGFWQVRDLSTNGTFVNMGSTPVGRDAVAALNDGDRLRLGGYEIEVRVEAEDPVAAWRTPAGQPDAFTGPPPAGFPGQSHDPFANPLAPPPPPPPRGDFDPRFNEEIAQGGLPALGTPGAPIPGGPQPFPPSPFGPSPFGPSPFAAQPPASLPMDFDPLGTPPGAPGGGLGGHGLGGPGLGGGFANPVGLDRPVPEGPTRGDHAPSTSDAFVPPQVRTEPGGAGDWSPPSPPGPPSAGWQEPNWDDLLKDLTPPGAARPPAAPTAPPDPAAFAPVPTASPLTSPTEPSPFAASPFAPPETPPPVSAPPAGPPPFPPGPAAAPSGLPADPPPFASSPFAAPVEPPARPAAPPAGTDPFPPVSAAPASPAAREAPPPSAWPAQPPFAPPPEPPRPPAAPPNPFTEASDIPPVRAAAPPPPAPPAGPPLDAGAGLEALLRGAGLPPLPPGTDPTAALHAAGAVLRASVGGIRSLLIARSDVKRAFRIEQTMLARRDNNPVKFAATDEASLHALLSSAGSRGPAALDETVSDLTLHQVATLAATQAAARALLDRVSPAEVEASNTNAGGILPGAREKRLWEAYKALHAKLIEQFEDDFDSAFGRAFARAYEQAAREAGRKAE
ncbi:type VI secretion system-associated FHA domain protein TagH [Muricoccus radiodurans]|uniref:type VI secretion system-associated FHA domain protein TagH n=1 Tax=Muricoccus radiodurans TaxID=2231721 RepID=UPI003CF569DA